MARRSDTPAQIQTALAELAKTDGLNLTLADFTRHTGISANAVYRHFKSWPALRAADGLTPDPQPPP